MAAFRSAIAARFDRGVLADGGVRAAAGLHADDPVLGQAPGAGSGSGRPPGCRCRWSPPRSTSARAWPCTASRPAWSCPSRPGRRHRRAGVRCALMSPEQPSVQGLVAHGGDVGDQAGRAQVVRWTPRRATAVAGITGSRRGASPARASDWPSGTARTATLTEVGGEGAGPGRVECARHGGRHGCAGRCGPGPRGRARRIGGGFQAAYRGQEGLALAGGFSGGVPSEGAHSASATLGDLVQASA